MEAATKLGFNRPMLVRVRARVAAFSRKREFSRSDTVANTNDTCAQCHGFNRVVILENTTRNLGGAFLRGFFHRALSSEFTLAFAARG